MPRAQNDDEQPEEAARESEAALSAAAATEVFNDRERAVDSSVTDDEADTDDELPERRGTYLPASVHGTPRFMRHNCDNTLALLRQKNTQYLFFITVTTDISGDWPEVTSRSDENESSNEDEPVQVRGANSLAIHSNFLVTRTFVDEYCSASRQAVMATTFALRTLTLETQTRGKGRLHVHTCMVVPLGNFYVATSRVKNVALEGVRTYVASYVTDGKRARGTQNSTGGSTRRRDERDGRRDWLDAKTTCAPEAFRRIQGQGYANVALP